MPKNTKCRARPDRQGEIPVDVRFMLVRFSRGTARRFVGAGTRWVVACALIGVGTFAGPLLKDAGQNDEALIISRCTAAVAGGGKATLTVSPLRPRGEIYSADYQVKVSPYFFKSEKGKLAVVISSETLEKARKGMPVEVTGTATTNGESRGRPINATVIPRSKDAGSLKVWFMAAGKKTVFDTSYRLTSRDSLQASKD